MDLNKKSKGAWIIHHANKLQNVTDTNDFSNLLLAGKCGVLLSALSESENEAQLTKTRVETLAKAAGVNIKFELPALLDRLASNQLIDIGKKGDLAILGVTTTSILTHTSDIFTQDNSSEYEDAAIYIAEETSNTPREEKYIQEFVGDKFKISKANVLDFLDQSEQIGFVDNEKYEGDEKFYFNGNLFRKGDLKKIDKVLGSLSQQEFAAYGEFNELIDKSGCVAYNKAIQILGTKLFQKLNSIGMLDLNTVTNPSGNTGYVTKPASFSKYGNPFTEDALDLAKAFVSSLYYGMTKSSAGRGRINMLEVLLRKLIAGHSVGPATAIGQDYNLLELKGVVQIQQSKAHPGRFYMKLLKKEIGEIALKVLETGNASENVLLNGSSITGYIAPEANRAILRKKQTGQSKRELVNSLRILRSQ